MLASNCILDEVGSTNDHARTLLVAGAAHGTWIAARTQTAGRGRTGREWTSQAGNLHLSVILRLQNPEFLTWLPLMTAVVCARAIAELGDSRVRLKWPNDLWILEADGWRKVGGILCEGQSQAGNAAVVIGIGINCVSAPEGATALRGVDAAALIERLVLALPEECVRIERSGTAQIKREYESLSLTPPGTELVFSSRIDEPAQWSPARAMELGEHGELWVWDQSESKKRALFSEEVSVRPIGE